MIAGSEEKWLRAEELLSLPEDGYTHELQEGLLLSEPQPGMRHGRVQARIGQVLANFAQSASLGVVCTQTGFLLARTPDTMRAPDVAFVRRERVADREDSTSFFDGAPDLAVEVLSPSNRAGELHAKVADYLAAGARLVWVVDPGRRAVGVYRTLLAPRRLTVQDVLDGEDVLPGFSIPVLDLFVF